MSNNFLFDENPLVIQPKLAECIGLNEAIILQQMNYWLKKSDKYFDGRVWIYNTYKTWNEQFPFFSVSTIRRAISNLEKEKIVITGNYNKAGFDKTKWYSIDNDALSAKINSACVQNEQTVCSNWTDGSVQNEQMEVFKMNTPIPETTRDYKENTTETNTIYQNGGKTNAYKKVVGMFENNGFGLIGGIVATNINNELEDFAQNNNYEEAGNVISKAIEIAVNRGKNNFGYVWGITKNWYQKKLFTVSAIEATEKKINSDKKEMDNYKKKQDSLEKQSKISDRLKDFEKVIKIYTEYFGLEKLPEYIRDTPNADNDEVWNLLLSGDKETYNKLKGIVDSHV